MDASELFTKKKYHISESRIKMNSKTLHELRDIAKQQDVGGYYKLWKADLIPYLLEQPIQETSIPLPRTKEYKRRPAHLSRYPTRSRNR